MHTQVQDGRTKGSEDGGLAAVEMKAETDRDEPENTEQNMRSLVLSTLCEAMTDGRFSTAFKEVTSKRKTAHAAASTAVANWTAAASQNAGMASGCHQRRN